MKRLVALLVAGSCVVPALGAYFAGVEVIPHTFGAATYGIPYVTVGYDAEVGFAKLGLSSPLTINGWYMIKAGGQYALTENLAVIGHFSVWGKIENFAFTGGAWAVGAGAKYKFDTSLAVFVNVHLPFQVDPAAPFWGMWVSAGFQFYFGGVEGVGK